MFYLCHVVLLLCSAIAAPQQPEINDQFETTEPPQVQTEKTVTAKTDHAASIENVTIVNKDIVHRRTEPVQTQERFTVKIYRLITEPLKSMISAPKIKGVLRNVGTCIVNGAMEIISYYLPTPVIPLLASAAGFVIPFEPVVMLREKMPVTSYRRAFKTAVNSFMSTFDKYKVDEDDFDPYMTRRFNRRFMNDGDNREKNKGDD